MSVTPYEIERQQYLDILGIEDDPSLTIGELKNMTGGGANVYRAAKAPGGSINEDAVENIINSQVIDDQTLLGSELANKVTLSQLANALSDVVYGNATIVRTSDIADVVRNGEQVTDASRFSGTATQRINSAISASGSTGAPVFIPRSFGDWNLSSQITVPSGTKIISDGATVNIGGLRTAFKINGGSTDILFDGLKIVGTLGDTRASSNVQMGIDFESTTVGDTIDRVVVSNCTFSNIHYIAIRAVNVRDLKVINCTFNNYGYAGVGAYCTQVAQISFNTFNGASNRIPTYAPNSYAAFASAMPLGFIDVNTVPQSSDVIFHGNIVRNQAWEALETHAGNRITFSSNIMINCNGAGISAVGHGGASVSSKDIVVANNIIIGPDLGTARVGITIRGTSFEDVSKMVTTTIIGNIIQRTGDALTSDGEVYTGGIIVANAWAPVVSGNVIREVRGSGIITQDSPESIIANNTITDVWRESGPSTAIAIVKLSGSLDRLMVSLHGNSLIRGVLDLSDLPAGSNINMTATHGTGSTTIRINESGNNWPVGSAYASAHQRITQTLKELREFRGAAPPDSDTWNRGDKILNSQPSAGAPIGWVCVTAGTPGTWKAYGTIAS